MPVETGEQLNECLSTSRRSRTGGGEYVSIGYPCFFGFYIRKKACVKSIQLYTLHDGNTVVFNNGLYHDNHVIILQFYIA